MNLKLKKVELVNIRVHKRLDFFPAENGITAICGPNGTGKSTIIDAIPWVLYGTKPGGFFRNWKNAKMARNGIDLKKDECYAAVEIEVDGDNLRIVRKIFNGGTTSLSVFEKNDDDQWNDEPIAGPAITSAYPYIRKKLNMDEKGFLAAIVVQQKQVDQLISTGPKERGKVIEKLTGITSLTVALNKVKEEHNFLKKSMNNSDVDEAGLEKIKKEYKDLLNRSNKLLVDYKEKTKQLDKNSNDLNDLKEKVEKTIKYQRVFQNITGKLEVINTKIESERNNLNRLLKSKDERKKSMNDIAFIDNFDEIKKELEFKREAFRKNDLELSQNISIHDEKNTRLHELEHIIDNSSFRTKKAVDNNRKDFVNELYLVNEDIKKNDSSRNRYYAKNDELKESIAVIKDGDGTCPTCLQEVHDKDTTIASLEKEIDTIANKLLSAENDSNKLLSQQKHLNDNIEYCDNIINSFDEKEQLTKDITSLNDKVKDLESSLKDKEYDLKSTEKIFSKIEKSDQIRKDYEKIFEECEESSNKIELLEKNKSILEGKIKGKKNVTDKDVDSLREKLQKDQGSYSQLELKTTKINGELNLLQEKKINLEKTIKINEDNIKKYKELLKSLETTSTSSSVIEEFRTNRIKNSVPVIESYASELLNRFTDGQYTQLKLDESFNATIFLSDGTEREVNALSGGELSAAAIALRLAISMLLNGDSSKNLIILDEVLVSQDVSRAELILQTIKDVCKGQVIIVAHNDEINSIADKTIELNS